MNMAFWWSTFIAKKDLPNVFLNFWNMSYSEFEKRSKLRNDEIDAIEQVYSYLDKKGFTLTGKLSDEDSPDYYMSINNKYYAVEITRISNIKINENTNYFKFKNTCEDFTRKIKRNYKALIKGQYGIFNFSSAFGSFKKNSMNYKNALEKAKIFIIKTMNYSVEYSEIIYQIDGTELFTMRKYNYRNYLNNEIVPYVRTSGVNLQGQALLDELQKCIDIKIHKMRNTPRPWILVLYDQSGFVNVNDVHSITLKIKNKNEFSHIFFIPSIFSNQEIFEITQPIKDDTILKPCNIKPHNP